MADRWKTSVWKSDVETRKEEEIFAGPVSLNGVTVTTFTSAQLSLDQRTLFILLDTGVTTADMAAIDLDTLSPRYFSTCAGFDVIRAGEHQGELILLKRSRDLSGFPYYLYWLYSSEGRELGLAGPDSMDLADAISGLTGSGNNGNPMVHPARTPIVQDPRWKTAAQVPSETASDHQYRLPAPRIRE